MATKNSPEGKHADAIACPSFRAEQCYFPKNTNKQVLSFLPDKQLNTSLLCEGVWICFRLSAVGREKYIAKKSMDTHAATNLFKKSVNATSGTIVDE